LPVKQVNNMNLVLKTGQREYKSPENRTITIYLRGISAKKTEVYKIYLKQKKDTSLNTYTIKK